MKIADAAHEKALQKEKPEEEKTKVVKECCEEQECKKRW